MARWAQTLVLLTTITILAHLSIYLNEQPEDDCLPRVIVKKEIVTITPSATEPSPTFLKLLPGVQRQTSNACHCNDTANDAGDNRGKSEGGALRGHGMLYKDIMPTKFIANQKKKLFILGYQRVGSSFFGQLFDENPNVFYIYEPLDAVYTEMYGTRGGLNVPSDITYYSNGTVRQLSKEENTKILRLLSNILDCNVDKLPVGFLLHRFWDYLVESYMPSWQPYRQCLDQAGVLRAREECRATHLGALCPERLGVNVSDQAYCRTKLLELEKYGRHSGPKIQPFIKYEDCLLAAVEKGKRCVQIYREKCAKATLWATKTVRGTMEHAEKLLITNPNLRLIHLIRDPRPVVTSRSHDSSYRGIFAGIRAAEGGDKAKEAIVYCGTVVKDIKYRRTLEKRFPGRVIQVIYEDFVQNPGQYAKAIYGLMDEAVPGELLPWIKSQTEGDKWKNNAMVRMNAWKNHMTYMEGQRVQENCKQFYDLVPYPWPY